MIRTQGSDTSTGQLLGKLYCLGACVGTEEWLRLRVHAMCGYEGGEIIIRNKDVTGVQEGNEVGHNYKKQGEAGN